MKYNIAIRAYSQKNFVSIVKTDDRQTALFAQDIIAKTLDTIGAPREVAILEYTTRSNDAKNK